MFDALMTVTPWDLIDQGVDEALDRLQGDVGVNGLSIRAASGPRFALRALPVEDCVSMTRGGAAFVPDEGRYAMTRCKPIASGRCKGRNPLGDIVEACAGRALAVRAEVSAAGVGRMVHKYPAAAAKNAFGAESGVCMCLANPDVQAYLCGLVGDLSGNYGLDAIVVTQFTIAWSDAFDSALRCGIRLDQADRALLSLCFCESCRQKAATSGVAVEEVVSTVRAILQGRLAGTGSEIHLAALLADNQALSHFVRWRGSELQALLTQLKAASSCALLVDLDSSCADGIVQTANDWSVADGVLVGLDAAENVVRRAPPAANDGTLFTSGNPTEVGQFSECRVELRVPIEYWHRRGGSDLVSALSSAVESGVTTTTFDEYGLLSEAAFASIKQAVRFAKRSAS